MKTFWTVLILTACFFCGLKSEAQYEDYAPEIEIGQISYDILRQIEDLYLVRDAELFSRVNGIVSLDSATAFIQRQRQLTARIEELYFLQKSLSRWDIFSVTLYAKEVSILCSRFEKIETGLNTYIALYFTTIRSRKMLFEKINAFDLSTLTPPQYVDIAHQRPVLKDHILLLEDQLNTLMECSRFTSEMSRKVAMMQEESETHRFRLLKNEFFCIDTNLYTELFQKRVSQESYQYYVVEFFKKQFPTLNLYWPKFWLYLLWVGIPFFFIGGWLFHQIIKRTKMGEQANRSRIFLFGFALLSLAVVLAVSRNGQNAVEATLLGRIGEWLFGCAILIMALSIRLKKSERRAAIQVYIPVALQNICAVLLTSLLMPYRALVILVPAINLFVLVWAFIALRKKRDSLPPLDRALGGLILVTTASAIVTAAVGWGYLGFTLMLTCFTIISNVLILFAVMVLLVSFTVNNPKREFINNAIRKLFLPAFTLYMLWQVFSRAAELFNVNDALSALMSVPIINNPEIMVLSLNQLIMAICGAFVLNYLLNLKRILVKRSYGEAAEVGFIPSLMTLSSYLFWLIYGLFVLVIFEVNYQAILVVLGALSMGLGFGMKDIVENFISGILLLVGQQLRPGDVVEYESVMGTVRRVRIRDTLVETFDGAVLTIPNSQVLSKDFRNWTSNNMIRRSEVIIGVAYGTDLERARKLILEAAQCTPFILSQPPMDVLTVNFGNSSIDIRVLFWTPIAQRLNVQSRLLENVYNLFNENGITIPFPQIDVHFDPQPKSEFSPPVIS